MLSLIVCTYNRASQLARCLRKFAALQCPQKDWELLVVDNNSSDHTQEVVLKFAAHAPFQVKYVFEGNQGLSHAWNRGIAEACHSIVAFTDDDCLVDRQWASTILREFSGDASLDVLGGRVERGGPDGLPIGTRTFSDRIQVLSFEQLFSRMIGCNMAFSKRVFDTVGEFDPFLGRGTSLGSAGDLDLFYRALKKGLKIVYAPDVVVCHAHGRSTLDAIQQVTDKYAMGRGGFYWKHIIRGDLKIAKRAGREIFYLIRASLTSRREHGWRPSAPRVLRNLARGALYRLMGR
jgi:GT2 family glycosyltransferase